MKNKKIHNINKTGFKTPDTYFESIEDRVFDKLNDSSFKDIAEPGYSAPSTYFDSIEERVLGRLKKDTALESVKDSGFKTPNNYFEQVEDRVMANLDDDKVVRLVPLFSRRNILYASGVAAALIIMFSIYFNKPSGIDTLDIEVVESYLEDQDIDAYDIASLLTLEDLEDDELGIIEDDFSEESLEEYLMDNANLEDIIEQ